MTKIINIIKKDEKGSALTLALIGLVVGGLLVGAFVSLASTSLNLSQNYQWASDRQYAADAGMEWAIWGLQTRSVSTISLPLTSTGMSVNGCDVSVTVDERAPDFGNPPKNKMLYSITSRATSPDGKSTEIESCIAVNFDMWSYAILALDGNITATTTYGHANNDPRIYSTSPNEADIFALNGNITMNQGCFFIWCQHPYVNGDAYASGSISDPGGAITGSKRANLVGGLAALDEQKQAMDAVIVGWKHEATHVPPLTPGTPGMTQPVCVVENFTGGTPPCSLALQPLGNSPGTASVHMSGGTIQNVSWDYNGPTCFNSALNINSALAATTVEFRDSVHIEGNLTVQSNFGGTTVHFYENAAGDNTVHIAGDLTISGFVGGTTFISDVPIIVDGSITIQAAGAAVNATFGNDSTDTTWIGASSTGGDLAFNVGFGGIGATFNGPVRIESGTGANGDIKTIGALSATIATFKESVYADGELNSGGAFGGTTLTFGTDNNIESNQTWTYDDPSDTWAQGSPVTQPSARYGHAMAYDSLNNKVVLFGGYDASGRNDETWVYDTASDVWTKENPTTKPSARFGHSMVYDSAHNRVILFGGSDASGLSNETWAYDVATNVWTQMKPLGTKPSARYGQAMVYDSDNNQVILFGGYDTYGANDETWVYDFNSNEWTRKNPATKPSRRYWHDMVYAENNRVLLFGGYAEGGRNGETWVYSPAANSWTQLHPASQPPARYWHAMAWDSFNNEVILFGGFDAGGRSDETWTYNFTTGNWAHMGPVTAPENGVGLVGHAMVYDSYITTRKVVLFGGFDAGGESFWFGDDVTLSYLLFGGGTNTFNRPFYSGGNVQIGGAGVAIGNLLFNDSFYNTGSVTTGTFAAGNTLRFGSNTLGINANGNNFYSGGTVSVGNVVGGASLTWAGTAYCGGNLDLSGLAGAGVIDFSGPVYSEGHINVSGFLAGGTANFDSTLYAEGYLHITGLFASSNVYLGDIAYTEEDISFNGFITVDNFVIHRMVIAEKNITLNSQNSSTIVPVPDIPLIISTGSATGTGNITFQGSYDANGVVYAPRGNVSVTAGADNDIYGCLVGKNVTINSSLFGETSLLYPVDLRKRAKDLPGITSGEETTQLFGWRITEGAAP